MPAMLRWATALLLTAFAVPAVAQQPGDAPQISESTADHSKFEALKKPFASGPEVTAACLSCHTEADDQMMHTLHFKWDFDHPATGQKLGKSHVVNAFCGNVGSNEPRCTSCHAGYGWTDIRKTPAEQNVAVDCLVCHDTSGQYQKLDNAAGHPALAPLKQGAKTITGALATPVDLNKAAQSVGTPTRENCGGCHFYGGGGDNVKHGDLSSALYDPAPAVDVHMSKDGAGLDCVDCHISDKHNVAGSRYATLAEDHPHLKPGERRDVATCQSCHSDKPHENTLIGLKLNDHTDRLACQTCHIPSFARGGIATKTFWDWGTAGKLKDGKPYSEEEFVQSDGQHKHTYLSTKGDFKWGENVTPYYAWFDGQVRYTNTDTKIDASDWVDVNSLHGSAEDPHARIWPFKRMEGAQAYDTELNEFVYNNVWGPTTDTALWTNFDWTKSIQAAMDYMGEDYSGHFAFAKTRMYWPITHMVAPAEQALECESCHAQDGRMAQIAGLYIPGTGHPVSEKIGMLMLLAAALGVIGHGGLRLLGMLRGNRG